LNTFNGQVVDNFLKPVQGASITIRAAQWCFLRQPRQFFHQDARQRIKSVGGLYRVQQRDVLLRNNAGSFGPSTNAGNQIILQQNTNALSEVAVVGYGSQKKNNKSVEDLMKKMPSVDVDALTFDAEPHHWLDGIQQLSRQK